MIGLTNSTGCQPGRSRRHASGGSARTTRIAENGPCPVIFPSGLERKWGSFAVLSLRLSDTIKIVCRYDWPMTDRLTCLCPGCKRTAARRRFPDADEWICGKHWPAVPKPMRQRLARARRRIRAGDLRWRSVEQRMWARCRQRAIEEALMVVSL